MKIRQIQTVTTFVLCILVQTAYAQQTVLPPDGSTPINKKQVEQIQKEVDEINALPLISDTTLTHGEVLYFDKQGKLRKYFYSYGGESERGKTIAFYDNKGEIIYYKFDGNTNCDASKEQYFIDEGRIVEGSCHFECECCEDEDGTLLDIDTTWLVTDTSFVAMMDNIGRQDLIRTDSLLNYMTSNSYIGAEYQQLPGTIPRQKVDQFAGWTIRYYDSLTAKALGMQVEILDSIDHPKAYFLRTGYSPDLIAVKKDNQYAVFPIFPEGPGLFEYNIERLNIDGIGSNELIVRNIGKNDNTTEEVRVLKEEGYTAVWDFDSFTCLLLIQDKYMRSVWHYDSVGNIIVQSHVCRELKVDLDKKRLTIRKVKDCNGGILGLTYKYKLTESGFVLEKVE